MIQIQHIQSKPSLATLSTARIKMSVMFAILYFLLRILTSNGRGGVFGHPMPSILFDLIFIIGLPGLYFLRNLKPIPYWLKWRREFIWQGLLAGVVMAVVFSLSVDCLDGRYPHFTKIKVFTYFVQLPVRGFFIIGEEIMFRGYLQEKLRNRGPVIAIGLTSILFFLCHLGHPPIYWAATLVSSIYFGILSFYTRSIWVSTFAHAMGNSTVIFISTVGM